MGCKLWVIVAEIVDAEEEAFLEATIYGGL